MPGDDVISSSSRVGRLDAARGRMLLNDTWTIVLGGKPGWAGWAGMLAAAGALLLGNAGRAAAELGVAMPYACTIERGEPRLEPAGQRTYPLISGHEQRNVWVCLEPKRGPCQQLTLHRFEFLCDGAKVAWMDAAQSVAGVLPWRMSEADGQLTLSTATSRHSRNAASLKLPKGFAPPPGAGFRIVAVGEMLSDGEMPRGRAAELVRVAAKRLVRRAPPRSVVQPPADAIPREPDLVALAPLVVAPLIVAPPEPIPAAAQTEPDARSAIAPSLDLTPALMDLVPTPEVWPLPPSSTRTPPPLQSSLPSPTVDEPPALSFASDGFTAASGSAAQPPHRSLINLLAISALLVSVLAMIGRQRALSQRAPLPAIERDRPDATLFGMAPAPVADTPSPPSPSPPPPPPVRTRTLAETTPPELQITHEPSSADTASPTVTPEKIDELQHETQAMLVIVRQMVHDHIYDPNIRALIAADVESVAIRLDDPSLIAQLAAGRLDEVLPIYGDAIRDLERARALARVEHERASRITSGDDGALSSVDEAYAFLGINPSAGETAAKKVVDALRQSWHPDLARTDSDRSRRDERMKRINAAWDLIRTRAA